jgi:hypothetical protein
MNTYHIRVMGHLDLGWADWLGNVEIEHVPDGTSLLVGHMPDQAALYGCLLKLRDGGMSLISIEPVHTRDEEDTL